LPASDYDCKPPIDLVLILFSAAQHADRRLQSRLFDGEYLRSIRPIATANRCRAAVSIHQHRSYQSSSYGAIPMLGGNNNRLGIGIDGRAKKAAGCGARRDRSTQ
jgi:hypothetical protein